MRFSIHALSKLPAREQEAFFAGLSDAEAKDLEFDWSFWARDDQLPPKDRDWLNWLLLGGRGAGKTRSGAEWVRDIVAAHPEPIQIALIGPTAADVRDVMVDGPSGILAVHPTGPGRPRYQPTRRRVIWPNGTKAFLYSAQEPDRLRGPQHHHGWCFVAGTMVATPTGERPIETLKPGDWVMTRKGPRRVLANARRNGVVGRVSFSHGKDLVGTGDHPVYSSHGWTRLDRLGVGDAVCVIDASSGAVFAGTSMGQAGALITSARRSAAVLAEAFGFIARSGARLMATSLPASTFITSTATAGTTPSPIWNWLSTPATAGITARRKTPDATGRKSAPSIRLAPTAERSSSDGGGKLSISASRASPSERRQSGAPHGDAHVAGPSLSAAPETFVASVASIWRPEGERFVFCLKVEGEPEYFANGVLVHNCDEIAAWQYPQETWDMYQFGLRLGENPRSVITTTPRPIKLLRDLINEDTTRISSASTYANVANLAPDFLKKIVARYEGTRLGLQELYAKLLTDNPDALWTRSLLDETRVERTPDNLDRIVVAVDPPTTSGENADECGIVVAGARGRDWRTREGFVLADVSSQGEKPHAWAGRVIRTARMYGADAIIVETNQGGEIVLETLSKFDRSIPIKGVHASRGKVLRAEPISALYEQKRVHHVGTLGKLEDQMVEFTLDFDAEKAGYSPDRLDAMVYALTDLMSPPGRIGSRPQ